MFVHFIFSSVLGAEWPPFGKEMFPRRSYVLFVFCLFVTLVISRTGFEGWIWVLTASAPDLCIHFTYFTFKLVNTCSYNRSTSKLCRKYLKSLLLQSAWSTKV